MTSTAIIDLATLAVCDHNEAIAERRKLVAQAGREALAQMLADDGYEGFTRTASGWQYEFIAQVRQ